MQDPAPTTKTATSARTSKATATRVPQTPNGGDAGRRDGGASDVLTSLARLLARQAARETIGSEADPFVAAKPVPSRGNGELRLSTSNTRARNHSHETE